MTRSARSHFPGKEIQVFVKFLRLQSFISLYFFVLFCCHHFLPFLQFLGKTVDYRNYFGRKTGLFDSFFRVVVDDDELIPTTCHLVMARVREHSLQGK